MGLLEGTPAPTPSQPASMHRPVSTCADAQRRVGQGSAWPAGWQGALAR